MQHGLAGHPESLGGFVEPDPAVGDVGPDAVADGLVDPDPPRCARSELFTGEEPVAQPSVDGDLADAEDAFGFSNTDHDRIIAVGGDRFWRLVGGDAARDPQRLDPARGEGQSGAGAAVLPGQDHRNGGVVVVDGEPADQFDGFFAGGAEVAAGLGQRHDQFSARAALPDDPQCSGPGLGVDGHDDLGDDQPQQLFAFPEGGAGCGEDRADVGAGPGQPGQLVLGEADRATGLGGQQVTFGLPLRGKFGLQGTFQGAGDQPVLRFDRVVLAAGPVG